MTAPRPTRRAFPLPACGERVASIAGSDASRVRGRSTRLSVNAPHPTYVLRAQVDLSPQAGRGKAGSDELLAIGIVLKDTKDGTTWEVAR